jgi:AbrB family looped-hinge helix DNA binding protein
MVLLRVQCGEGLVPLGFLRYFAWYSSTMRTTIDKAGRVVIPAAIRDRAGLTPGTELEITVDDTSVRIERVAPGPKLVRVGRRLVARPTASSASRPTLDIATLIEDERNRWP